MKTYLFVMSILFGLIGNLYAQGENSIWMFGRNFSLDFNHNPPLLRDGTYVNGTSYNSTSTMPTSQHKYNYAQAVCDANGDILFIVKNYVYQNSGSGSAVPAPSLFDRDEYPIAGTDFLNPTDLEFSRPIVIPHPGNPNLYYIFYVRNGGLIYCIFDMTLNNGKGNIIPGFKNVLHANYNTISSQAIACIQACDGVWLIAKHKTQNQYLSFKIDATGLAAEPVVSVLGYLPTLSLYNFYWDLVPSANGKLLAAAMGRDRTRNIPGGIELYDFEKCSGKLSNARLIDTGNLAYGVAFSPDNSKLYVASNLPASQPGFPQSQTAHNIYQFDLSLINLNAIENSKTLVLSNPTVQRQDPFCPNHIGWLGSMRIGKDGRLYLTNGQPSVCPGTGGAGLAIHIITQPNLPGIACSPNLDAIFNSQNGMPNGTGERINFPIEIIKSPEFLPDSVKSPSVKRNVCFQNEYTLSVPSSYKCIEWSNGMGDTSIVVSQTGTYWVRYYKGCTVHIDSFDVEFFKMPLIIPVQYGCPGFITLQAGEANAGEFDLDLYNDLGGKIYGGLAQSQHSIYNLDEGVYRLRVKSEGNCDTTIMVELKAYPTPELSIHPPEATIQYGTEITLKGFGATYFNWSPGQYISSITAQDVIARPTESSRFTLIGTNEYGCRDTAYATISIAYNKHIRLPNAFTPNGDGTNDLFALPEGQWNILKFEVYNRYGEIVYLYNANKSGWDGRYNGKDCEIGVYYYSIRLAFPDGTNMDLKGDVNLIR